MMYKQQKVNLLATITILCLLSLTTLTLIIFSTMAATIFYIFLFIIFGIGFLVSSYQLNNKLREE